jgi:alpha 1,3-glucosidase
LIFPSLPLFQNNAEGQLYLDDGESFDYDTGAFAWKSLTFDGSSIVSKDKASVGTDEFRKERAGLLVERIVLIGFSGIKSSKAKATVEGVEGDRELEMDTFTTETGVPVTTVRLPNVPAVENWAIKLA